jgi:hypothetical protein
VIAKTAASNPAWRKLGGGGSEEEIIGTLLSVILLGRELGISPMVAISGAIRNIQGQFEISAKLMNDLIRRKGHRLQLKSTSNELCTLWGKRCDTGEEMVVSYHIEDARRAGLIRSGGGWDKFPSDMLFARAFSRLARRLFPDCINGTYVKGELQETMLNEPVENPEDLPEMEAYEEKIVEISFELPEDVEKEKILEYAEKCAQVIQGSINEVIERANENPEGFLSAFQKWQKSDLIEIARGEKRNKACA